MIRHLKRSKNVFEVGKGNFENQWWSDRRERAEMLPERFCGLLFTHCILNVQLI